METKRKIITDKLVIEKTGKTIQDWFQLLDEKGALSLPHIEIFKLLSSFPEIKMLGEWNQNLLTTTYEWDRGLKERNQKGDGNFEISVSKTVNCPIETLFQSLVDNEIRKHWLNDPIVFRKTTLNKSARITWTDEKTSLSVDFYEKGIGKSQIVVQHLKIDNSETAAELKIFWSEKLNTLKQYLER